MTEPDTTATTVANSVGTEAALQTQLSALQAMSADNFDPVRFQFIEALLRRAQNHNDSAREIIHHKALAALQDYQQRFEVMQTQAAAIVAQLSEQSADTARRAQALLDTGNFAQLRRLQAQLAQAGRSPEIIELHRQFGHDRPVRGTGPTHLDDVLRQQEQQITAAVTTTAAAQDTPATKARNSPQAHAVELASGRQLRRSQEKSSARQRVRRAISECPEEAGPLNPQRLVIRALTTMESLSPDYTHRFMAYVDTLLYLQQLNEQSK